MSVLVLWGLGWGALLFVCLFCVVDLGLFSFSLFLSFLFLLRMYNPLEYDGLESERRCERCALCFSVAVVGCFLTSFILLLILLFVVVVVVVLVVVVIVVVVVVIFVFTFKFSVALRPQRPYGL